MKLRTVYFKVADIQKARAFWEAFLDLKPHKDFPAWLEFKLPQINLGLLPLDGFTVASDQSNFVPVFEYGDDALDNVRQKTLTLGGAVIVDIADHPDGMSYVMADPCGNEFEITRFHD